LLNILISIDKIMPEAFRPVSTIALHDAIKSAPKDITRRKEISRLSEETIQKMSLVRLPGNLRGDKFSHNFKEMYDATIGLLDSRRDINSFNRYLISTATTFASSMMIFDLQELKRETREQTLTRLKEHSERFSAYQFLAVHYLLQGLTKKNTKEYVIVQQEMARTVRKDAIERALPRISKSIEKAFIGKPATALALNLLTKEAMGSSEKKRDRYIKKRVDRARKEFSENISNQPPIRFMMGVYNDVAEYCRKKGVENPLLNLTLGDVTGLGMDNQVAEALALNPIGPKGLMLGARARMHIQLAYMSGKDDDKQRYEGDSLGWLGLRKKFIQYGQERGLYSRKNPAVSSIIGEGGADALFRVSRILNEKFKMKWLKENEKEKFPKNKKFKAYFANPAFRMVSAKVRDAGFDVYEEQTTLDKGFRPDLEKVEKYLDKNKDCKVFVYVPINNPSSDITEKEYMDKLIGILRNHGTILINDMAYLGTGNLKKNKELAQSINTYENRVDVYSMSKIFARTGLRCGCAVSTIKELSEKNDIIPVAQGIQLGNAYPMQAEALAIWDLVGPRDRKLLNEHYKGQQKRMIDKLRDIDEKRVAEGKTTLFAWDKDFFADAALYAYVPLTEGVDAFEVIKEAGLVGTPDSGFFQKKIKGKKVRYLRFALGVEEIPEKETTT